MSPRPKPEVIVSDHCQDVLSVDVPFDVKMDHVIQVLDYLSGQIPDVSLKNGLDELRFVMEAVKAKYGDLSVPVTKPTGDSV